MKTKFLMTLGVMALSCAMITGCGSSSSSSATSSTASTSSVVSESSETTSSATSETSETDETDSVLNTSLDDIFADIDVDSLVTLGEYKGLDLTKEITEVTDDDVQSQIETNLSSSLETVDRPAEEGDTVNIDYVGTLDGEEFDGGSATGYDLELGSDSFIDGFEDGLIGASAGDEVTLNLTFPEGYSDELGGKDVVFTVTVNSVQATPSAISDEWVQANSDYDTVEDYTQYVRETLEASNESEAEYNLQSAAWDALVDSSTVSSYPDSLKTFGEDMYAAQMEQYCSYYGVDLDTYLENMGVSEDDYNENMNTYAESMAEQLMILVAVENKEGISVGDDGYTELLQSYLDQYGVDEDTFISYYGRFTVEETIMMERITDIIIDNANVTEKTVSAISETSETE